MYVTSFQGKDEPVSLAGIILALPRPFWNGSGLQVGALGIAKSWFGIAKVQMHRIQKLRMGVKNGRSSAVSERSGH